MTTRPELTANSQSERWGACGILLSMDCIQPFIKPMGLHLDAEKLKHTMREAIIANRTSVEKDHDQGSTFEARALEYLDLRFNASDVAHFIGWFLQVFTFDVHDHSGWQQWKSAFLRFSTDSESWAKLSLPSRCSTMLFEKYLAIARETNLWELWSERRRAVLSEWDLEMYSIHEFDDESKDPFNWVILTYETNCVQRFWSELKSNLNENELHELWSGLKNDPELPPNSHLPKLADPLTLSLKGRE
jgi:hypothetical protein